MVKGASGKNYYFTKVNGFETEASVANYFKTNGRFVEKISSNNNVYYTTPMNFVSLEVDTLATLQIVEEEVVTGLESF
jgi:hypothetical protein